MNPVLLSICIPTRDRVEILKNTLSSIYNSKVDLDCFEVVIYDSSENSKLRELLTVTFPYRNLKYTHGENNGFLNLVSALRMGTGEYLKLQNDYSGFTENSLQDIIDLIRENLIRKPVLFFGNSLLRYTSIRECDSFDIFLYEISYFSTWSNAFGIWKDDFSRIKSDNLEPMFPHTSMLFLCSFKNKFKITNNEFFITQPVSNKGGYNLFRTFAVDYVRMLNDLLANGTITYKTHSYVKKQLLLNFMAEWYCNTKIATNDYSFDLSEIKENIQVYYSSFSYYLVLIKAYFIMLKLISIRSIKLVIDKSNKI